VRTQSLEVAGENLGELCESDSFTLCECGDSRTVRYGDVKRELFLCFFSFASGHEWGTHADIFTNPIGFLSSRCGG
jgi:hypothetical protein